MPLQATSGAASYDAFGGGVPVVPNYIEDVFSTYLYTGNSTTGGTQTITNNIDLSTKGGMVWIKGRSAASNNILTDTTRGAGTTASNNQALSSNLATAEDLAASYDFLSAFNTTGFAVTQGGTTAATRGTNYNAVTYASWTFRKQPKFFDVVTYTGNGTANTTIAHNLGSEVGCLIVKRLDTTSGWSTLHKDAEMLLLQSTNAQTSAATTANRFGDGTNTVRPTSTQFTLGSSSETNASGGTYVAYLFAHDAGGFGLTGTDNVISCGSYTEPASGFTDINLGYEVQWLLTKSTTTGDWVLTDIMQGMSETSISYLKPNSSAATTSFSGSYLVPTATGFRAYSGFYGSGTNLIYIAIRRGPMKVPTDATKVFKPVARSGTGSTATITAGFPVDLEISKTKTNPGPYGWFDRLRGATLWLTSSGTDAEATASDSLTSFASNTGVIAGADTTGLINYGSDTYANWMFQRAPSFMDVVCDSTGGPTIYHNLGVAPQLIIAKVRNYSPQDWFVDVPALGSTRTLNLNLTGAASSTNYISSPTATQFTTSLGGGGYDYVYYLFATCAGVSKVGSYTGTGTTLQIDCGFTGGARFVLIKRTNSTGDWYVWDSARGIVAGNDPYLLLNTTGVDVTNTDYVDTYSAGFEISSTAPAAINGSGSTFIFLAIS